MNLSVADELSSKAWEGFEPGNWQNDIDVRDFIQIILHMKATNHSLPMQRTRQSICGIFWTSVICL